MIPFIYKTPYMALRPGESITGAKWCPNSHGPRSNNV